MNTNEFSQAQATDTKLTWNAPTLTELSVALDTASSSTAAGDGLGMSLGS